MLGVRDGGDYLASGSGIRPGDGEYVVRRESIVRLTAHRAAVAVVRRVNDLTVPLDHSSDDVGYDHAHQRSDSQPNLLNNPFEAGCHLRHRDGSISKGICCRGDDAVRHLVPCLPGDIRLLPLLDPHVDANLLTVLDVETGTVLQGVPELNDQVLIRVTPHHRVWYEACDGNGEPAEEKTGQ